MKILAKPSTRSVAVLVVTSILGSLVVVSGCGPAASKADKAMMQDSMKTDGMMKDDMKSDGMMKDGMMKDGMKSDGMMKDGMKSDGMMKDGMKSDGMMKDGAAPAGADMKSEKKM